MLEYTLPGPREHRWHERCRERSDVTISKLEVEDTLGFKQVSDAQITPDGETVAFVMGDQFVADSKLPKANIWTVSREGGAPQQITTGTRADI